MTRPTLLAVLTGWLSLAPLPGAESPSGVPTPGETVLLSPFQVNTTADVGYLASSTQGGTRLNTSLRDVASQVAIMTPEFLEDIAATTLEDAYRYSINVENMSEWQSASTNNGDFNQGTINNNTSRTRGLGKSSESHDFFNTAFPLDTYNSERFTLTSGPNAILFGLGSPSGLTDTTFKRAKTERAFGAVMLRTDDEQSLRTSTDLNIPLLNRRAALRFSTLHGDTNLFRTPAGDMTKRYFATVTIKPLRDTQVRGWYENLALDRIPMRNTLVRDLVTPWVNAGRPLFNNFGLTTTAAVTNRITANGQQNIFGRRANNGPQYTVGQIAGEPRIGFWANTVETLGPSTTRPSPDTNQIETLKDVRQKGQGETCNNARQTRLRRQRDFVAARGPS